jgi:hypothetical protein
MEKNKSRMVVATESEGLWHCLWKSVKLIPCFFYNESRKQIPSEHTSIVSRPLPKTTLLSMEKP